MYHNPTRRCQKRQSEQVARVNAPESAQIGRPNLKATRRNVDALSKVRQNWYVYFRDGAFTFARYDVFHAAASAIKDLSRAFTPWSHVVALIYQQLTKTERFASHRSSIPFPHSPLHFRVVIAPLVWLCQIHVFPLPPKSCRKRSRNGWSASPSTLICPVKRLCVSRGSAFHGKFPETSQEPSLIEKCRIERHTP